MTVSIIVKRQVMIESATSGVFLAESISSLSFRFVDGAAGVRSRCAVASGDRYGRTGPWPKSGSLEPCIFYYASAGICVQTPLMDLHCLQSANCCRSGKSKSATTVAREYLRFCSRVKLSQNVAQISGTVKSLRQARQYNLGINLVTETGG